MRGRPAHIIVRAARGRLSVGVVVACLAGMGSWAQGQYQVNPQVNQGGYGGIGNNGASPSYGSVRYASQSPGQNPTNNPMLESQVRQMNFQSGNLPSQIRASQTAAGPLAPTPLQTPLSAEAYTGSTGGSSGPLDPAANAGSVRYSQAVSPQGGTEVSARPVGGQQVNSQVYAPARSATPVGGSVRYGNAY